MSWLEHLPLPLALYSLYIFCLGGLLSWVLLDGPFLGTATLTALSLFFFGMAEIARQKGVVQGDEDIGGD